jgi:glycosyltransferase involved in cell wall biosynthesis
MKTIQLSVSLSRAAGGIFEIQRAISQQLESLGVGVVALGLLDSRWVDDAGSWSPVQADVYPVKGPGFFGFSPALQKKMLEIDADLVHLHYMWMFPSIAVSRWSSQTGRPYLVTPNGMLEPWALRNSAWKKKLAGFFYERRMLHGAACLQANTARELQDIRSYGLNNPVCVIPNGVDLPFFDIETLQTERSKTERKTLLFLGRLHPKKGLVNALKAWSKVRIQKPAGRDLEEWQFIIAGWDQVGHYAELKQLCNELGLRFAERSASNFIDNGQPPTGNGESVVFTGPAFGEHKDKLLRRAHAFILPSFSEGLPMSILEAWAYGLPVMMTDECNLPEGFEASAALKIGTGVQSISDGLRVLHRSTVDELRCVGENGRMLVERQYAWSTVAAQMKEVYEWMLGGGSKPECLVER